MTKAKDKIETDCKLLTSYMLDGLRKGKKLVRIPNKRELFSGKLKESAVLMLSDIHAGKVNHYLNYEDNEQVITYNEEKMIEEFNRLTDSLFGINQLLAPSYNLEKLYIFGLGDWVDNDIIFRGQQFFIDYGVGKQFITLLRLLTDFLEECLKMYDEVELITIGGNHGRMTHRKDASPACNNFDYLMGKMLETIFEPEERVNVIVSESWFYLKEIESWKYLLHHGDTIRSHMGIPYYGLVRQGKSRRIEMNYDIECIGHFHQKMEIPIGSNAIALVNGAWIENDDFAWRTMGVLSRPEQWYFGVSPKRPRTWQFPLDLLHSKNEWKSLNSTENKYY